MHLFLQTVMLGVLIGGVYALLASGLTLIFGVMGIINVAQGALLILSCYFAWLVWQTTGLDPMWISILAAPLMFAVGWVLYRLLIVRVRGAHATMSVLLTFALAITLEGILGVIWTGNFRSVTPSYFSQSLRIGDFFFPTAQVYGSITAVAVLLVLYLILSRTREGRAIRATAQNRLAAQLVGVDADRVAAFTFALGAATAGVGGAILSVLYPFAPGSHYLWISRLLGIIVLGGMGSLPGAALGAVILGVAETLTSTYISLKWATVVFYVVIFVVLLVRPQGLMGTRLREDVQA
ncbi:MAG: branched-chain amino acid ABC transporter permease [Firmicutes bacterium]|nr:branched-chain amino acid ABC transporter permease [Bacillota bacterium]